MNFRELSLTSAAGTDVGVCGTCDTLAADVGSPLISFGPVSLVNEANDALSIHQQIIYVHCHCFPIFHIIILYTGFINHVHRIIFVIPPFCVL